MNANSFLFLWRINASKGMYKDTTEAIGALKDKFQQFEAEIHKVIIGQEEVIRQVLTAIFSGGHVLLLGVPGLAKTLLVNTIARILGLKYKRIQFTPDLMPSDIIGSEILDENRKFKFIQGPIFANIILADEINRTPPKTQAALLEAMQEKAVTVSGVRYELEEPFFVLATQNPIEQEGTYPLPEAQLDRFMFNIVLDYPSYEEELKIAYTTEHSDVELKRILDAKEILYFQDLIRKHMPVSDTVLGFAVRVASRTRPDTKLAHPWASKYLNWGAGPRASQFLILAAKAHAGLNGKFSPDIEDVKAVALPILRHRIIPNYRAQAEGLTVEDIITEIIKNESIY